MAVKSKRNPAMPWAPTGRTALFSVRCTPATRDTLRALAAARGVPMAALFDEAVALLVARYKLKPPARKPRT